MNTDEGRQKYKSLNSQLRRATDKAREKWWEEQCSELEQHSKQGRMDLMYRRVAELTKQKKKKHNTQVKDSVADRSSLVTYLRYLLTYVITLVIAFDVVMM